MAPAKLRKRKSGQDQPSDPTTSTLGRRQSKRQKNLPVRTKDDDGNDSKPSSSLRTPAAGTLKVFDDDEDNNIDVAGDVAEKPTPAANAEDLETEDSDDDDAAPEAVSTHQAAAEVRKSSQVAQKAAQEQATAQKRKRQQRDALFKEQAEERKKIEDSHAAAAAKSEPAPENEDSTAKQPGQAAGRRRMDRMPIPNVLPAEFLTDESSDEEEEEEVGALIDSRPKGRKISTIERQLSRQDRATRDRVVGSSVYRVTKQQDGRMAPKVKKYARGMKEALLKRNRAPVKSGKGFFAKK